MATKFAAFGAQLQYKPVSTWLVCAGVRDISGPGYSADTVDVTTHDSSDGFREHLKTLIDAGDITFDLVWDPEDALGQAYLLTEMQARTVQQAYILLVNGVLATETTYLIYLKS